MPSLPRGLYEELITEALEASLQQAGETRSTRRRSLPQAEAADADALQQRPTRPGDLLEAILA